MNTYGNGTQANQNRAHRNDAQWIKTKGNRFEVAGQKYISEYLNPFTGWAIRKHFGTGLRDGAWFVFDESGDVVETIHSLTWAKAAAAVKMGSMNTAPAASHVRDMWFEMLDQSVAHYVTDTVSEVYPMTADGPRFVRVREDDGTIQLTALTNDRAELICSEVTVSGAATSPAALATIIEAML